ncbi:MAG TPA: heterodisulfide reductase-related iron-sulfur binding cluster [Ktedonobacterales bacterium]|jgi:Fe-S oxidoreductase|nr:heterodisulfide reductase-related iron-sulfur binding cluster [Ktedonobacterales bacterium]
MFPATFWPAGGLIGAFIFGLILFAAWALFASRISELVRMLRLGRPEKRTDHFGERVKHFTLMVLGQRGVLRDPLPGIAHFFTFWGFIIIQLDALNLWAMGFNFEIPIINSRAFAVILDIFLVAAFISLLIFAFRRLVLRPRQLQSQRHGMADAYTILGLIALVLITVFFFEVFAYVATNGAFWTPLGALVGQALTGIPESTAYVLAGVAWWANVLVVLGFLIYLPRSKHLHLIATPFNVFFRNHRPAGALDLIPDIEEREDYGVSKVSQFTWKQLLDGYACTECGRCNSVCPALATGKPLWPKEIILGVKEQLFDDGPRLLRLPRDGESATSEDGQHHEQLVGQRILEESLWACTNCGACVEICPVDIEHVQKIEDMRRHLVLEESSFPQEVQPLFTNLERNGNPWEISNDTRAEWAQNLGVKTLAEDPDAEVLYWVGCMGSFDARNRKVATAFAKVMNAAGVRFGILGPEESCNGDPARRIGNEYLWQMLAQQNIETLNGYGFGKDTPMTSTGANGSANGRNGANGAAAASTGSGLGVPAGRAYNVKTVVATCPHCFNTIKNEYPQLGGNYEVVHHTEFIDRLISTGQLKLPAGFDRRKLTYHDPCFIGRWNGVYDEPRRVLNVINAGEVAEMSRNRNRSFCCGGGGGRVWMEENTGKRINNTRVEEALSTGADAMAAACPFCITMFEDGIKGVGAQERFAVEDISEILARALEAQPAATDSAQA